MNEFNLIMNNIKQYAEAYDNLVAEKEQNMKYINDNYIGSKWQIEHEAIINTFRVALADLQTRKTDINNMNFSIIINKLKAKVVEGVNPDLVAELQLFQTTKVTIEELMAYAEKYINNYLVIKVLREIAEKKDWNLEIKSLSDLVEEVAEMQAFINQEFFKKYNGIMGYYNARLVLHGAMIRDLEKEISQFIK